MSPVLRGPISDNEPGSRHAEHALRWLADRDSRSATDSKSHNLPAIPSAAWPASDRQSGDMRDSWLPRLATWCRAWRRSCVIVSVDVGRIPACTARPTSAIVRIGAMAKRFCPVRDQRIGCGPSALRVCPPAGHVRKSRCGSRRAATLALVRGAPQFELQPRTCV